MKTEILPGGFEIRTSNPRSSLDPVENARAAIRLFSVVCPVGGRSHAWSATLLGLRRHGLDCPFCGARCEVKT